VICKIIDHIYRLYFLGLEVLGQSTLRICGSFAGSHNGSIRVDLPSLATLSMCKVQ